MKEHIEITVIQANDLALEHSKDFRIIDTGPWMDQSYNVECKYIVFAKYDEPNFYKLICYRNIDDNSYWYHDSNKSNKIRCHLVEPLEVNSIVWV